VRDSEGRKHRPGPRYRLLLAAVYDADEHQIFGDQATSGVHPWRADLIDASVAIGELGQPGSLAEWAGAYDRDTGIDLDPRTEEFVC
jgi:hypothetical protein